MGQRSTNAVTSHLSDKPSGRQTIRATANWTTHFDQLNMGDRSRNNWIIKVWRINDTHDRADVCNRPFNSTRQTNLPPFFECSKVAGLTNLMQCSVKQTAQVVLDPYRTW